ncbi:MAG: DUF2993 domain-containing protein [Actinomycetota bacterium]|nr:MAG: DUF2993 domain-containing protein [Actinomycetota bacterium]
MEQHDPEKALTHERPDGTEAGGNTSSVPGSFQEAAPFPDLDQPGEVPANVQDDAEPTRSKLIFAAKAIAIGLMIGIVIGGVGFIRNVSSQSELAGKLIKLDSCLGPTSVPSGFCFNSAVNVLLPPRNPISELLGSHDSAVISASQSRIGIFGNAALHLNLTGLTGNDPGSGATLGGTEASAVSGTLSLAYSDLNNTLQSGSANGASIYYAGNNEIATSNQITYQGQQIPLVVISKIELKNNQLYLTPETVNALGRTAPASTVFSNVAPVQVDIPSIPIGMRYQGISTTRNDLIFHLTGQNLRLSTLFNAK